jgi:hypothetical protein
MFGRNKLECFYVPNMLRLVWYLHLKLGAYHGKAEIFFSRKY